MDGAHVGALDSSVYTNWVGTAERLFADHGCKLTFRLVPASPYMGGAFPIGPRNLVLCTKLYAWYYEGLDVEDVKALDVEGFDPVVYPHLVYRRDTSSPMARSIIEAAG